MVLVLFVCHPDGWKDHELDFIASCSYDYKDIDQDPQTRWVSMLDLGLRHKYSDWSLFASIAYSTSLLSKLPPGLTSSARHRAKAPSPLRSTILTRIHRDFIPIRRRPLRQRWLRIGMGRTVHRSQGVPS